jgi:dTMP kinase
MPGVFITFEGGEGAGKSTHIQRLAARLASLQRPCVITREPGGTKQGEALRELLVTGATQRWSARAEALLNYAARDAHLEDVIRPSLARGEIVICDRFMDSTRAYQGYAGGCPMPFIDVLEREIVGNTRPDLTIIFDLDPESGLGRAANRDHHTGEDRYERKGLAFHTRLREGFLAIARLEPSRCRVVDASRPVAEVERDVWNHVGTLIDG